MIKFLTARARAICVTHWKEENVSFCSWPFSFWIAQLHPGPWWHAAYDAGSGLHLHCVYEHQEPGAGEGAAAQRGAARCWHPELGSVGFQVHGEHCSARGSLWAHKCPGQGQWKCWNGEWSEHKACIGAFKVVDQAARASVLTNTSNSPAKKSVRPRASILCLVFRFSCLQWSQPINTQHWLHSPWFHQSAALKAN